MCQLSSLSKIAMKSNHTTQLVSEQSFEAKILCQKMYLQYHTYNRYFLALAKPDFSKGIIGKGSVKRVGDGKSIKVWEDKWIPFHENGKAKTQKPPNTQIQTVDQLLANRRWNKKLVEQTFSIEEASKIMRIPVSLRGGHVYGIGGPLTMDNTQ